MLMLGDDIAWALPDLQAQAESAMVTPCRFRRSAGTAADPVTGADVTTYADVWSGLCKVQDRDLQVTPEEIPGASVALSRWEVQVPVSAGPFLVGDVVETFAADDTAFATPLRTFRVAGLHRKTWQTAQRLPVEEQ